MKGLHYAAPSLFPRDRASSRILVTERTPTANAQGVGGACAAMTEHA
jgi:hypothetical protein